MEVFGAMNEVFAIDTSPKMNDFARLLLQGGNEQARLPAGYFFRLHLPKESTVIASFKHPFFGHHSNNEQHFLIIHYVAQVLLISGQAFNVNMFNAFA